MSNPIRCWYCHKQTMKVKVFEPGFDAANNHSGRQTGRKCSNCSATQLSLITFLRSPKLLNPRNAY